MKSSKEVAEYFKENKRGIVFFYDSIDDYATSRFLMNNGFLREGLIFGSQAIEKMLTTFILLTQGKFPKKDWDGHNLLPLREELKKTSDLNLDKYSKLLKRLSEDYRAKYMEENLDRNKASWELKEIDELYLFLVENLPIIDGLKYITRFFQYLFSKNAQDNYASAIKENNDSLKNKISKFKTKWEEFQ